MAHDKEVVGMNPGTMHWMDVGNNASYYIKKKNQLKVGLRERVMKGPNLGKI
jgi:hypothetical protein